MTTAVKTKVKRKVVSYKIYFTYPTCFDDGGPFHDEYWSNSSKDIDAKTDKAAQLASLGEEFHKKEHCRHGRYARPTKIEKTVVETTADGFERTTTTEVTLPRSRRCDCGVSYMPIRGETACHTLVATSSSK